jgi:hypothetical protein
LLDAPRVDLLDQLRLDPNVDIYGFPLHVGERGRGRARCLMIQAKELIFRVTVGDPRYRPSPLACAGELTLESPVTSARAETAVLNIVFFLAQTPGLTFGGTSFRVSGTLFHPAR